MSVVPEGPFVEAEPQEPAAPVTAPKQTRRDLGRLSIVTDGVVQENDLSERVERIIDEREAALLEAYMTLSENDKLNRQLEGDRPLGQRQTFAQAMYGLVHAHAAPFWESEAGKRIFNPVPERAIRLMLPYYYREVAYRPVSETGFRQRYKPIAVRVANHYPEVHFADRLRTMLQRELSDANVQTQAANDLITILGMAIDVGDREK
jgi:hypothetical protein